MGGASLGFFHYIIANAGLAHKEGEVGGGEGLKLR